MLTFNFTPFPVLQTSRLLLRKLTKEDVHEMFLLRSDPVVLKYIAKKPAESFEEVSKFMDLVLTAEAENQSILWAITIKGENKMVGTVCLWNLQPENHRAEIGYVLLPQYHGQSIMNEAIAAVTNYGFKKMNLHCIEAHVNPQNIGSVKVLEKNFFVREALLKENQFFNEHYFDTAIYTLFKRDWEKFINR